MKGVEKIILSVLLLIYLSLSLVYANSQGFWHDEIYSLTFLKGISAYEFVGSTLNGIQGQVKVSYLQQLLLEDHFIENFYTQILHEGHPPLYFLFL